MQIDKYTLYGTRLLVFHEDSPQSNQYRQVCLSPEHFKKVSDAVCGSEATDGEEEVEITMSVDRYKLPDLMEIDIKQNA